MKQCYAHPLLAALAFGAMAFSLYPGGLPHHTSVTDQVDSLFARWNHDASPGCAVAVVQEGAVVYQAGYGMANLEHKVPITPETVFDIASMSKQFTAASIALLAERGALSLDEDIRRYLPEMPSYERPITIRHLIHHTSGLRGYFTLWSLMGRDIEDPMPEAEVLDLIARQRHLNFTPGTEQFYSNSNYFLLALIVERVSGQTLRAFAAEHLFAPLGMHHTRYYDDATELLPNRAQSYSELPDSTFGRRVLKSTIIGDGGVYSTVEDLALWDHNFYQNRLGDGQQALIDTLLTPAKLEGGTTQPYAFGLRLGTYRGLQTISHGGTMGGYRSFMVRFPAHRFTSVVLCNQLEISPFQLSHRVADLYLEAHMRPRSAPPPPPFLRSNAAQEAETTTPLLPPEQLNEYAGPYHSAELETSYTLRVEGNRLFLVQRYQRPTPLVADAEDRFRLRGLRLLFERDAAGAVTGLSVQAGRVREITFTKQ